MDTVSPPRHQGNPSFDPPRDSESISLPGSMAFMAIGIIISVGLLFIPPLALGVGLGLGVFALFTLIVVISSSSCCTISRRALMTDVVVRSPRFDGWSHKGWRISCRSSEPYGQGNAPPPPSLVLGERGSGLNARRAPVGVRPSISTSVGAGSPPPPGAPVGSSNQRPGAGGRILPGVR